MDWLTPIEALTDYTLVLEDRISRLEEMISNQNAWTEINNAKQGSQRTCSRRRRFDPLRGSGHDKGRSKACT